MSQQQLFFMFIVTTSLFIIVQMRSVKNNPDGLQRFQRGFGNRRDLINALKHHYPKEILLGLSSEDNVQFDKYLFSNHNDELEQNDLAQEQQPQISLNYR